MDAQIKDSHVTLGGEVTSAYNMGENELKRHVRDAICAIGYTPEYAKRWGAENCIDPDALDVTAHVGAQSPDIAQGVVADGWGDQGIFWGMATGDGLTGFMPLDHTVAKRLGMWLYESALKGRMPIGLDIKTQVTVKDGAVAKVVVAAPTMETQTEPIRKAIMDWLWDSPFNVSGCTLTLNGTGSYVRHASAGDCGTTGRKLAVDFYGGACRIGGGSCWGKDPSKADVTLNVYARRLALEMLEKSGTETVYCAIDCCIGRREIGIVYLDGHLDEIAVSGDSRPAREVIAELGLRAPVWAFKCRNGLFAVPDAGRA